jgi:hypothetical protein
LGKGIETPHTKNVTSLVTEQTNLIHQRIFLDLHKQWEMNMNFGTWNMRSLNWSGTFKTVDRKLAMYSSGFLGIQYFLLGKGVTE